VFFEAVEVRAVAEDDVIEKLDSENSTGFG